MCLNISRAAGRRVREAVVGGNQAPSQAPDVGMCDKCGRLHGGECMVGSNAYYGC